MKNQRPESTRRAQESTGQANAEAALSALDGAGPDSQLTLNGETPPAPQNGAPLPEFAKG
jgi:hypothetical protein